MGEEDCVGDYAPSLIRNQSEVKMSYFHYVIHYFNHFIFTEVSDAYGAIEMCFD